MVGLSKHRLVGYQHLNRHTYRLDSVKKLKIALLYWNKFGYWLLHVCVSMNKYRTFWCWKWNTCTIFSTFTLCWTLLQVLAGDKRVQRLACYLLETIFDVVLVCYTLMLLLPIHSAKVKFYFKVFKQFNHYLDKSLWSMSADKPCGWCQTTVYTFPLTADKDKFSSRQNYSHTPLFHHKPYSSSSILNFTAEKEFGIVRKWHLCGKNVTWHFLGSLACLLLCRRKCYTFS